jgi:hypothetical protein
MDSTDRRPTSPRRLGVAALLAGLVVLVPWGGGNNADPATCYGMFGAWTVPADYGRRCLLGR